MDRDRKSKSTSLSSGAVRSPTRGPTAASESKEVITSPGLAILKSRATLKILLLCCIVVLPMLAFTATVLWLVFGHPVSGQHCPYPELCPSPQDLNRTSTSEDYLVDYPAARLVFIASWSSTASFSLIGVLMTLYAYTVARNWTRLSSLQSNDGGSLPTPFHTSILFRILNAELWVLLQLTLKKLKDVFWSSKPDNTTPSSPYLLRSALAALLGIITMSVFIQAADTYLHIATQAIDYTQVRNESTTTYQYSRGLSEECLGSPKYGNISNTDFWGCNIQVYNDLFPAPTELTPSKMEAVSYGFSTVDHVLTYSEASGEQLAVLAPILAAETADFRASSFGVSSKCQALNLEACNTTVLDNGTQYDCDKDRAGLSIKFVPNHFQYTSYFYDWHKFIEDTPPFDQSDQDISPTQDNYATASNLSAENANTVFQNPWRAIYQVNIYGDAAISIANAEGAQNMTVFPVPSNDSINYAFFYCNHTVLNVDYSVINSEIMTVEASPSNSSTTGIVSMLTLSRWSYFRNLQHIGTSRLMSTANSSQSLVEVFAREISRAYVGAFAAQTSPRPALLVQSRRSMVVTRVPKAAIWTLIVANSLFSFLAIGLAVAACLAEASTGIQQVQIRLNITGLTAQLFEKKFSEQRVKNDQDLFEERDGVRERIVKRVTVEPTDAGGAAFALREGWEE